MPNLKNNQIPQASNETTILMDTKKKVENTRSQALIELLPELKQKKDILLYLKLRRRWNISEMNIAKQKDDDIILKELELINKYCVYFLDKYPEVKLRISGVESKPFFYIGYDEGGVTRYKYLSKKTYLNLIIIQANRKYISKLKKVISSEIASIKKNRPFDVSKKYNVYDEVNPRIRKYVIPLLCSPQFAVDCWGNTKWKSNDYMEENKIYETNRGEKVRSKSEKMIADLLNTYTNVEYVYEGGVYLDSFQKYIYPDFVILNRSTGRIAFLEHAGMLDNSGYANDFVRKINEYAVEEYVVGKDLYITAETQQHKYNSITIKKTIDYICK